MVATALVLPAQQFSPPAKGVEVVNPGAVIDYLDLTLDTFSCDGDLKPMLGMTDFEKLRIARCPFL